MDDQLDNDIKKRIREVFEHVEDPSADEGWLQLRKKFPADQSGRPPVAWIWWSAAALLLLFMGIGLWLYSGKEQPVKLSVKPSKKAQTETIAAVKGTADSGGKTIVARSPNATAIRAGSSAGHQRRLTATAGKNTGRPNRAAAGPILSNDASRKNNALTNNSNTLKNQVNPQQTPQLVAGSRANNPTSAQASNQPANNLPINPVTKTQTNNIVANTQAANTKPANTQVNSLPANPALIKPKQQPKTIASMFAGDQPEKKNTSERSKAVHFGIYAATFVNYAKGSNNQANVGAGVTADIRIAKNLSLVTGVTIAQNSLDYSTGVPDESLQTNSFPAATASNAYAGAAKAYSAITVATQPAFKDYNARLAALDVPLNLKYDLNAKKVNAYILAGVSSGTFINETYTYQYNYPALQSPSLQQVQDETTHRSFSTFYFARTLNLAVGIGYPVGKNRLILEPFLKYPLQGLGSQNLRFGAGGVNLKLNFQAGKK